MTWDELYTQNMDVEGISKGSEEYQIMFSAAMQGNPSAQYCMGLWSENVNERPDVAQVWFRKSAQQDFEKAIRRLNGEQGISQQKSTIKKVKKAAKVAKEVTKTVGKGLELFLEIAAQPSLSSVTETAQNPSNEQNIIKESATEKNSVYDAQFSSLIIKEHDFQEAKNSLKKYTEQAKKNVELSRVPYEGGLFNLQDHRVTGSELNRITSQIQEYLISLNNLGQGFADEFGEVYKAFESLDKDYISGIVASIKAAEEVSRQEQKDRKDIKELVAQHELSVTVLKKFKEDIDKLKHVKDIDELWDATETATKERENIKAEIESIEKELGSSTRFAIQKQEEAIKALTQKVKILSIVAGSAVLVTMLQLFLNILGIF